MGTVFFKGKQQLSVTYSKSHGPLMFLKVQELKVLLTLKHVCATALLHGILR